MAESCYVLRETTVRLQKLALEHSGHEGTAGPDGDQRYRRSSSVRSFFERHLTAWIGEPFGRKPHARGNLVVGLHVKVHENVTHQGLQLVDSEEAARTINQFQTFREIIELCGMYAPC